MMMALASQLLSDQQSIYITLAMVGEGELTFLWKRWWGMLLHAFSPWQQMKTFPCNVAAEVEK